MGNMSDWQSEQNYWTRARGRAGQTRLGRRRLLSGGITTALGVVGLATVGCGSSNNNKATSAPNAAVSASATRAAAATAAPGAAGASPAAAPSASASTAKKKQGGTVTLTGWIEGDTLDPVTGTGGQGQAYLWCFYDNLVAYDANLNPDPSRSLAQSWETPDDTTIVFHLRPNVKFHDGSAVDANAVKASILHGQDKSLKTNSVLANLSSISAVDAIDAATVRFKLSAPNYPLLTILGDRPGFIVNMANLEKVGQDAFNRAPNGSGAFTLKEWVPGDHLTMVKNPNYWQAGNPVVDSIIWKWVQNTSVADQGFLAGQASLIWGPLPMDWDAISKKVGPYAKRGKGVGVRMMYMNNVSGPFTNDHLRKAVAYAMDREAILKTAYSGFGTVAHSAIAPGNAYAYDASVGAQTQTLDLSKAKTELAAAGLPSGQQLTMTANVDPLSTQMAAIMKANLQAIGLDLQVNTASSPNYYLDYFDGKYNSLLSDFSGRADPVDTLDYLYITGGSYVNQKIQPTRTNLDDLIKKATATKDPAARGKIYQQVAAAAADSAYDVYFVYPDVLAASNKLQFTIFGDGKPHLGQGDVWFEE